MTARRSCGQHIFSGACFRPGDSAGWPDAAPRDGRCLNAISDSKLTQRMNETLARDKMEMVGAMAGLEGWCSLGWC